MSNLVVTYFSKTSSYKIEVEYNGRLFKVSYVSDIDDWLGSITSWYMTDQNDFDISDVDPDFQVVKNFLMNKYNLNE